MLSQAWLVRVILVSSCLFGSTAAMSPRVSQGRAELSGTVVADTSDRVPLAGAIVTLSGGDLTKSMSTITDEKGFFSFGDLPGGRFTLSARKSPFVAMAYGADRPDGQGTPITIAPTERRMGITIRLPRGAVITGTLRDASGLVAPDVSVWVVAVASASAVGEASGSFNTVTDDRGEYRLYGLSQGEYLVVAVYRAAGLGPVGIPSLTDMDRRFAELLRSPQVLTTRTVDVSAAPVSRPRSVGFAPTFYPGTSNSADAAVVVLGIGEERVADFAVAPVSAGTISGAIETVDRPVLSAVTLDLEQDGPPLPSALATRPRLTVRPTQQDGRFVFEGVPPGRYWLAAQAGIAAETGTPSRSLWALQSVTSYGDDISGITLTLRKGAQVSGRTVFDGTSPFPSLRDAPIRVRLVPALAGSGRNRLPLLLRTAMPASVLIEANGTFTMDDVVPGPYLASVTKPAGWWARSALVRGTDVLDTPITLDEGRSELVLTFSDRSASLSGFLLSPDNLPGTDLSVIVFSNDPNQWGLGTRRNRIVRPATDGRFIVPDLPSGSYLVVALSAEISARELASSVFLADLAGKAVKVTLAEGEQKTLDLRIARVP